MTTGLLKAEIMQEEGLRTLAYPDPISGGNPWTIGYGHTGPDVRPNLIWSEETCDTVLDSDLSQAEATLTSEIPWWTSMGDTRQDAIVDMCFNMGWPRLSGFKLFLAAAKAGDYPEAADQMMNSLWAHQVPSRAKRLSYMMRNDARPQENT